MQETESIDEYILQHIDPESDYLKALYRDTHVKLLRPRMASGHLQGRMLKMFVKMIRPRQILEIGTYSGYSALCLAEGLSEGGMLHTFEIKRMKMSGMKKSPLRAAATMLALTGLRMVCISMLVSTMLATSGKLSTCHRKATEPTATTAASSRKMLMMEVEKMKPRRAQTLRKTVPHLMQKKKASFTRP